MLTSDVFIENPFVNSAVRPIQWRDCEIYVIKTIQCNTEACLALIVNKAVGLKMHFIGFQTTCYHAVIMHNFNKHVL